MASSSRECWPATARDLTIWSVRYQRQAVAVSYRLLGNSQDAMEVTQDAFLKAFTSLDSLQKPEAFGGWLMRIVSNLSLNYRRSRKIRQQLPLDDVLSGQSESQESAGGSEWMSAGADPEHLLESREMGAKLTEALEPASGKAASGDCDVHDPGNASEAGRRGAGMLSRGREVARVSGKEEVEGNVEGTFVMADFRMLNVEC